MCSNNWMFWIIRLTTVLVYSKQLNVEHPLFQEKWCIRTPTLRVARTGVAKCLLAFDSLCGARARVTEHLLAHYRRFWMSTRLLRSSNGGCTKHVLTFDSLCGARTGIAKNVLAFNSLCGAWMGVAKCVIAFDTLCGGFPNVFRQSLRSWNGD